MDPGKIKEELQNSSATSSEANIQRKDPSPSLEGNLSHTKGNLSPPSLTPSDTAQTPTESSEGVEGQGVKRTKEISSVQSNDPAILNSSSQDSPKAKKARKDDIEMLGDTNTSPNSECPDKDKDTSADVSGSPTPRTSLTDSAPKVPPIKIVLQSHGSGSTDSESLIAASQPHVPTTTSLGFPYIVTTVSADSSGIPVSGSLTGKDKNRGEEPKSKDDPLRSEVNQREGGSGSNESVKSGLNQGQANSATSASTDANEHSKLAELSGSGNGGSAISSDDRPGIDGTQSPSLLSKEKPTRVTRSSQRIATTVHSSPVTSPKTSNCSSPTLLDSNTSIAAELPCGFSQDGAVESPPVVGSRNQEPAELHPRKRKLKAKEKEKDVAAKEPVPPVASAPPLAPSSTISNVSSSSSTSGEAGDGPGQSVSSTNAADPSYPILNCVEMYLNIRKQIERRRQSLFPVQPKPPQGFKDYLMNRGTYVLSTTPNAHMAVPSNALPSTLAPPLKDLFLEQEKERHRLRLQQVVEKEKLVLSVEQEILRVHGRAARALSNQALPFSVCTFLKDEEVYNLLTPEQEEKDRNVRSRYNGRLFLSWLQDVDDKWEKIKESMVLRHHNEAESLYAVQKMDWEWKMKEVGLCEPKATPVIDELSVPMVFVSDDFDLLPA